MNDTIAPEALPRSLNIGCGYDKRPGFLNINVDPACAPDLLIVDNDLSALPRRHFTEIVANDVLEHIPRSQSLSALLDWADLTAMDGVLHVSTSSILGVAKLMEGRPYADQYNWTRCLFGNQLHPGDFHHTGFTEATLNTHLLAAGFEPGPIALDDGWLFRVTARKVDDWTSALDQAFEGDEAFVRAIYQAALDREPDPNGLIYCVTELGAATPRRTILKHLYGSEERLYKTAARYGL